MKFKYLLLFLAAFTAAPWVSAQNRTVLKDKTPDVMIPHLKKESVRSLRGVPGNVLDTIDTQTPGVQIVLYENSTWKYYRDPSVAVKADVFNDHWDEESRACAGDNGSN